MAIEKPVDGVTVADRAEAEQIRRELGEDKVDIVEEEGERWTVRLRAGASPAPNHASVVPAHRPATAAGYRPARDAPAQDRPAAAKA